MSRRRQKERSTPSQYGPVVRNGVRQTNARTPRARGSGVGITREGTDTRAEVMLRIWCAVILRIEHVNGVYCMEQK